MTTGTLSNGSSRTGRLILAAAPIGRPQDASAALMAALGTADVIAAEDTRRLRRLAAALDVRPRGTLISFYEDVEAKRVPELIEHLTAGREVLLITDAGMPGISDPGYRLVTAAVKRDIPVTVLPGPSAVTAALAVSGLPTDRFCFEGFPPRRQGERARRFAELAEERRTLVFFESPRRLPVTLKELAGAFGADRNAVICRELTKTHEEIVRGTLAELAGWAENGVLGEITLVISGAPSRTSDATPTQIAAEVAAAEQAGSTRSEAMSSVAARLGLRRREVYDAVLASKRD